MVSGGMYLLATAFILYAIGVYCLLTKRNLIRLLIGLEILMNAANVNFISLSTLKVPGLIDPLPHSIVVTAIVLDGALMAVGLMIVIAAFRRYRTLNADRLSKLRW